jgi:hypothetical protein
MYAMRHAERGLKQMSMTSPQILRQRLNCAFAMLFVALP